MSTKKRPTPQTPATPPASPVQDPPPAPDPDPAVSQDPASPIDPKHPFAGPEMALESPGTPDAALTSPPAPIVQEGREMIFFRNTVQGTEFEAVVGSNFAKQCLGSPDLVQIPELSPEA